MQLRGREVALFALALVLLGAGLVVPTATPGRRVLVVGGFVVLVLAQLLYLLARRPGR